MKPCEVCGDPSEQWHHLQPRSIGGRNTTDNLMRVCAWCHRTIHAWFDGRGGRGWNGPTNRGHVVALMREGPPFANQVARSMWGRCRARMKRNGLPYSVRAPERIRAHFINRHTAL